MKQYKAAAVQTVHDRIFHFLSSYNFQKVNYLLKKGAIKDRQILGLALLRGRGRPRTKIKKPKNRVIEDIEEYMAVKQSLDTLLDTLLSYIVDATALNSTRSPTFKSLNAFSTFQHAYLNAAVSYSTKGSNQPKDVEEEDLSTQKAFILDFPLFEEIDNTIQLQVHHLIHYIIEIRLINDNLSFNLDAIREIEDQHLVCPYFASAIYAVVLAMLFPRRPFRYYLYTIYILLKTGMNNFEVLQRNLGVNMNIPGTLKLPSKTTLETFNGFLKDFFDLSEIFVKGQSFASNVYSVGVCVTDNDERRPVDIQEVIMVLTGWKLTFSCVVNIFLNTKRN